MTRSLITLRRLHNRFDGPFEWRGFLRGEGLPVVVGIVSLSTRRGRCSLTSGGERDVLGGGDSGGLLALTSGGDDARSRERISDVLVGRFHLTRLLGEGGMGSVYEAHDRVGGNRVALKVLRDLATGSRAQFKREFRSLHDMQHPNLVRFHELFEEGDRLFFTMDLVDGYDFLKYVRQSGASTDAIAETLPAGSTPAPRSTGPSTSPGPVADACFDEAKLRDALAQLFAAVEALHAVGLVHRDIKPSNILVTRDGSLRLLDFGLVIDTDIRHSVTHHIVGTVPYMAPEQASVGPVGPAADWYAVGVLLFEALTGTLPFAGGPLEILVKKRSEDAPTVRSRVDGVPEDLDRLCAGLLHRDPALRRRERLRLRVPAAVESSPALSSPRMSRDQPFVGRRQQLDALQAFYERSRQSETLAVLVSGESGIGKTALVRHWLGGLRAGSSDVVVLQGRCYECESIHYKGVDGVVESLVAFLRAQREEAALFLPRNVARLLRQFPAFAAVDAFARAASAMAPPADPQHARAQAIQAFRDLLHRVSDRFHVVIHIDDIQWIDADGAMVIDGILQPPEAPRLLVVATSDEAGGRDRQKLPCATEVIALGPLTAVDGQALASLYASREGIASGDLDWAQLAVEADGHPILLDELVRHAARLEPGAPRSQLKFDEALARRIGALGEPLARLLELASFADGPISHLLAGAILGLDQGEVSALAARLRAERLCVVAGAGPRALIHPAHQRLRRAVVERLDTAALARVHRDLATGLEAVAPTEAERIAGHWERAGESGKAAPYAVAAARAAVASFAFDRAASLYRLALAGTDAAPQRRELLVALGESLAHAGRGAESAAMFLDATTQIADDGDVALRRLAAEQYLRCGSLTEGFRIAEDLAASAGIRLPRSRARSIGALLVARGRMKLRGLRYALRESSGPDADLDLLWGLSTTLSLVEPITSVLVGTEYLLRAMDRGSRLHVERGLRYEATWLAALGKKSDRRRSARLLREADRLVDEEGTSTARGWRVLAEGACAYFATSWSAAIALCDEAAKLFELSTSGAVWEQVSCESFALTALVYHGDLTTAAARRPAMLQRARERGDEYASVSLRLGMPAMLSLVASPGDALAEADEAIRRWPGGDAGTQRYLHFIATTQAELFSDSPANAWGRVSATWGSLGDYLGLQGAAVDLRWLRARAAIARALAAPRSERGTWLRVASREAGRIERIDLPMARGASALVRAGIAGADGDDEKAAVWLARAADAFALGQMKLHAAAVAYCDGLLLGGAGGRARRERGQHAMGAAGVADAARMSRMLAPGCGAER